MHECVPTQTVTTTTTLALLHQHMGRRSEALPLMQPDLEASERTLGPEHPSTIAALSNLAQLHQAMGQDAEA